MSEHAVSSEVAVEAAPLERILDAAGDLSLATLFLVTWIAPGASLALPLSVALLTMLLEFVVVHSTGFMGSVALADGPRAERARKVLGLGGFYTLFVGGFALGFGTWWPLIAFWGLTLNRSIAVLFDPHPGRAQRLRIRKSWAAITLSYLAAVFLTTFMPMPGLGITPDVVRAAELPASGLWVDQPERVVAAGFLHFLLSGVSALLGHRWISDASIPRQE
jgi:hypothetical protein